MRVNRILLSSALIVVAMVLQVSVLARLHLPGAVPDLLLLTVLGLALVYGHVGGALVGDTAARHVGLASLLFTAALYDLLLAPFVVPGVMFLARRADNDPLAEAGSPSKKATDITSGWISNGTGLKLGGQRGGLGALKTRARTRTARVGRIKGVKRL